MRKVLSFVLVLALVLSSFSMAFAADTKAVSLSDVAGNANEDAIQVAYDLGIVTGNPDGTFLPGKAVNRAEFAAMITRALAIPESALAGYTTTTFKDTVGYGWAVPYLAFCQSKGIMLGDGAGNVMPGRTITVNEAMTMALRAIGYTANSSLLVGVWPSNYVSIAQNNDLYDDVAKETTVNKASAAQIIYNVLTVQKVAVNTDGSTDYLWKDKKQEVAANLLNTNHNCTEVEDVILGYAFDYDNSLINITGKIGAFGTAYKNKDGDLVAFVPDSTVLTGKVDGDKFKVGDTKYDLPGSTTVSALFANTNVDDTDAYGAAKTTISDFASTKADGGETVTINVDLSGKRIKEVYSVVAWKADDAALAEADVQEDIEDQELLGSDFDLTDDDEIDFKSFQLVGIASLDKIAKDDVVYIYTDGDYIRKIAVGTETVEGTVEEIGDDFITVNGKDYEFPAVVNAIEITDFDVDDEGTFYLDVDGNVFDFDGSSGATDTFGVVKAFTGENSFDNFKIKLYMSDDSTKTLYFADDAKDIDWVSSSATTVGSIVTGALIGYNLDSNGDIDTVDNTASVEDDVYFQSTKVLKIGGASYSIDSNAVVFTYKTSWGAAYTSDYDVAKLSDVKKGDIATSGTPASIILNKDSKVVAMFVEETAVDVEDDDVYGVFNTRTSTKTGDDNVYRFTGFIDGTAFNKKTDDRASEFNGLAGVFGVYKITVDANDVITAVAPLSSAPVKDSASGIIAADKVITDLSSDRTVITTASGKYTIADDAVVYKYDEDDEKFSVAKLSNLRKNYKVSLYDTKGEDADGIASVVIYMED